jgi:hypothetical protein
MMRIGTSSARKPIRPLLATLLLAVAVQGVLSCPAFAKSPRYSIVPVALLGGNAPGGGKFDFDFEPTAINNAGDAIFAADVSLGGEGMFALRHGALSRLAFDGPAPGGGNFGGAALGGSINESGYAAFAFSRDPFSFPLGVNVGLYVGRLDRALEAVVVPEVTLAPGGGVFAGVLFAPQINDRRQITFTGVVHGVDIASGPPGEDGTGLGLGVFLADAKGKLTSVVRPGDAAPGGGLFDLAATSGLNDRGDVVFGAHVQGEPCLVLTPQFIRIACVAGTYLRLAATGEIRPVVRQGGALPGGRTCYASRGRLVNNSGAVAFGCNLEPVTATPERVGLFLQSKGTTSPIVVPGDAMPGGGTLQAAGVADTFHLSNAQRVIFVAELESGEQGLYVWSRKSLSLIARTGTVVPGIGTIVELLAPDLVGAGNSPFSIGANERGDVLFTAAVDDGSATLKGVLLIATTEDPQSTDD